jgi:photosystem II stability/assembly factor-like uncharacterized protein
LEEIAMMRPRLLLGFFLSLVVLGSAVPAHAGRWRPIGPWGGALSDLVVDPKLPQRLFALAGLGEVFSRQALFVSEDGGDTWTLVGSSLPGPHVEGLVVVPGGRFTPNARRLLAYGTAGLWASGDGGRTWFEERPASQGELADLVPPIENGDPLLALDRSVGPVFQVGAGEWVGRASGLPADNAYSALVRTTVDEQNYLLASTRGVYRSQDGAQSWLPTAITVPVTELVVGSGVVYAFNPAAASLWRSGDLGAHWQRLTTAPTFTRLASLHVDARDDQALVAVTDAGTLRSADGGSSWELASPSVFASSDLLSRPRLVGSSHEPDRLYASFATLGVVRSDDGGASWHVANRGLSHLSIEDLALAPAAATMVQVIARAPDSAATQVWKTRSGGGPWRVRQPAGFLRHTSLAVKPNEFPLTLVGTTRHDSAPVAPLARTTDGGESWLELEAWGPLGAPEQLVFDAQRPRRVYARVFDRVAVSDDAGLSWSTDFNGLPEACERRFCPPLFPRELEVSPTQRNTLYFLNNDRLHRSRDAGASWQEIYRAPGTFPQLDDLALDPRDPNRLYLATAAGVYASRDGGRTFQLRSQGLPTAAGQPIAVQSVVADPSRSGHLLAVLADGRLFRSRNAGQSWKPDPNGLPASVGAWRLVAHPAIPHRFLALTRFGGVWQADLVD